MAMIPETFANHANIGVKRAASLNTMRVVITGKQPELTALFSDRYERAVRIQTARKARMVK